MNWPPINPDDEPVLPTLAHVVLTAGLTENDGWDSQNFLSLVACAFRLGIRALTIAVYPPYHLATIEAINQEYFAHIISTLRESTQLLRNCGIAVQAQYRGCAGVSDEDIAALTSISPDEPTLILNLLHNNDGRSDLLDALCALNCQGVKPEDVDQTLITEYLSSNGLPEPDLIVFTGGERRLINLLTWQTSYSEYLFVNTLWTKMDAAALYTVIQQFQQRQRRFGKG
jgi:undecaprenyl diphosphate synthase